jgi:hypothetical protein
MDLGSGEGVRMQTIRGQVRNGTIFFDGPIPTDWTEGTEIVARPAEPKEYEQVTEENWPTTPEEIEEWIKAVDNLEPFLKTEEEEREFQKALDEQKAWELSNWDAYMKRIEGLCK